MNGTKAILNKNIVTLAVMVALIAACSGCNIAGRTSTKSTGNDKLKDSYRNQPDGAGRSDNTSVKKSAGATIFDKPEKIELVASGKTKTFYPGDKVYEEVREAGERIMLRVSGPAGDPTITEESFSEMIKNAPILLRFVYRQEPLFSYFRNPAHTRTKKGQSDANDSSQITFFISEVNDEVKPCTIYDGFFYGTIHMVSTLTNYDLVNAVKELK